MHVDIYYKMTRAVSRIVFVHPADELTVDCSSLHSECKQDMSEWFWTHSHYQSTVVKLTTYMEMHHVADLYGAMGVVTSDDRRAVSTCCDRVVQWAVAGCDWCAGIIKCEWSELITGSESWPHMSSRHPRGPRRGHHIVLPFSMYNRASGFCLLLPMLHVLYGSVSKYMFISAVFEVLL